MSPGIVLRSSLFALFQIGSTLVFTVMALLSFPLKPLTRYRIISGWAHLNVAAARILCGIRYRVIGRENIPDQPCIILSKHQSAWETMAYQVIFPPQVWVLKRELLWVPFFGWGLAMLSPIAIDRGAATRALKQTLDQGRERLAQGFSIVIFPEGTRTLPGKRSKYHSGGAWLALQTGRPVLPVAHNAGELWRRNAFLKRPGLITVSIGAPIPPQEISAAELNQRVEQWIEGEMQRISTHGEDRT